MSLFAAELPQTNSRKLTEKYQPHTIAGFRGLVDRKGNGPKKACAELVAAPYSTALMFVGPSGTGKTTLALALAAELQAEIHHIPSYECDIAAVTRMRKTCAHLPAPGKKMHLVLIDEADQMTKAAQIAFLSILDCTAALADTVIVFTANETEGLHDRFLSRCELIPFSSYGMAEQATSLLADVWAAEAPAAAVAPNFARIVKDSNNNVRAALMSLQRELANL